MAKWVRIVVAMLICPSCGGSGTATSPTQASIVATLSPNPVTSTFCSPSLCQAADGRFFRWRAEGTLTVQETAGIAGSVTSITVTAFNPQFVYTSDFIVRASGTNRVAAHGTLAIPLSYLYGLVDNPLASRSVMLPYVVAFSDDRGNQLMAVATWTVN